MEVLYGRSGAKEVVLTFGNFDGVHRGHMHIFSEVVRLAGQHKLTPAALTFVPHTAMVVKKREHFLLIDFERKVRLIANCGIECLHVVEFGESFAKMSPEAFVADVLVKCCKAKYIVVGRDCIFGYRCKGNIEVLRTYSGSYGYEVVAVSQAVDSSGVVFSSSTIRECVESGDMKSAKVLLGRYHSISGTVLRGSARGRLIGFPTLNLSLDHVVVPKRGVYYARVNIGTEDWLQGIVNVGVRPTFAIEESPVLEMHIFDFEQDIYERTVTVELIDFIRPEQKFSGVERLVEQIRKDIDEVRRRNH